MIRLFNTSGTATKIEAKELPQHLPSAVWVDLLQPDDQDYEFLKQTLRVDLPKRTDLSSVQTSSQLYAEDGVLYMTTPIIASTNNSMFDIGALAFILTKERLITLRYLEPKSIDLFAARAKKEPGAYLDTPMHILLGLLETMVDRSADILEMIGDQLDDISFRLFRPNRKAPEFKKEPANDLRHLLSSTGHTGDLLGKFSNALSGSERIANFLSATPECKANHNAERLDTLQRDIRVLEEHADSLQERTIFILDAVLGAVSIEQNDLFKILSILSMVLMPPTLIAGIYGMNFKFLPELDWHMGYPLALLVMLASALLPLMYFRRKGWM